MITAVKEIMEEMLIAGVDTIMTNEVESMKTVLEDIIGILVLLESMTTVLDTIGILLKSMKTVLDTIGILLLLQSMKTQTVILVNTRMTAPTMVMEA
jgi:hypothetical protein